MSATYEACSKAFDVIRQQTNLVPKVGIICGSGLGGLGDLVEDPVAFSYAELPGFHVSQVAGHKSKLLLGRINGVDVVCMQGRFHGYEGISYDQCAFPIRVMKLLGIESIIVTHAAGGLNETFNIGDFMIIKDHLPMAMWASNGPLVGPNEDKFGPRFPPMVGAYNSKLMEVAKSSAERLGISDTIRTGVVGMMSGPTYETVAENRMLKMLGCDTVGMSVCPEVIVAHHCGIKVFAVSMVTNKNSTGYDSVEVANHQEVVEVAKRRAKEMERWVTDMLPEFAQLQWD